MPKLKKIYIYIITQFNVAVERIETHRIKEHETQQKNRNPATKTSYSLSTLSHSLLALSSSFSLKTISKTPLHPPPTTRPPIPPLPMTRPSGTSSALSPTHLTSLRTSLTLAPSARSLNLTPPPPPRPHPI